LTRIKIDKAAIDLVAAQGLGMDDVPPEGKMIKLTLTWNMSTGASRSTALSKHIPRTSRLPRRPRGLLGWTSLASTSLRQISPSR
jgi:hypothetical protein